MPDLEKMIRKSTKVAKDKFNAIKSREKRKLRIKEKKFIPKQKNTEKDYEL